MSVRQLLRLGQVIPVVTALALVALVGCGGKSNAADGGSSDSGGQLDGGSDAGDGGDAGSADARNHTFANAAPITVDSTPISATLVNVTSTPDYYKFSATAGDRLTIAVEAQALVSSSNGDDSAIVDTVVTVFDSTQTQIAQDDDAWPRFSTDSQLFFEPPSTGTYYIRVGTCQETFSSGCGNAAQVTIRNYEVFLANTANLTFPEANAGTSQDGTVTNAVTLTYMVPSTATGKAYGPDIIDGNFPSTTSTQVFSFTPPADTVVATGQAIRADFWVQPVGPNNGDGSTSNVKMWVTTGMDTTTIIAEVDQSNYLDGDNTDGPIDMAVPITLGNQYYLFVQNEDTTSNPATDYYFMVHYEGTNDFFNGTPETEGADATGVDDTAATAQVLSTPTGFAAGLFGAAGWIGGTDDVDWYEVDPPSGITTAYLTCSAERAGSGVRGLQAALYKGTTTTPTAVTGSHGTEGAATPLSTTAAIAAGTTQLWLKVSAASQDSTVTGTYYYCIVNYQ